MVAAHHGMSRTELVDKMCCSWLTRDKHTETLEDEPTLLHPAEKTAQNNTNTEWTKRAGLLLSIVYSRVKMTYYVTVITQLRSRE